MNLCIRMQRWRFFYWFYDFSTYNLKRYIINMKYLKTLSSLLSILGCTDVSILLLILLSYSLLLFSLVICLFLCLFLVKFFLFTFKRFYGLMHSSTWCFVKLHWFFVYFMSSFIIIQDSLNKGCIREFNVSD